MPVNITIPETITVHLGPPNSDAQNVTVSFVDYIKNVASSEIYPTWPEDAIRANVLAQISFALNRIYTEHYRTRGYNFDITSSPAYDQAFVYGRNIFENISEIVDETFNDFIIPEGGFLPLFTQYCDGKSVQCDGLSQWGSVDLAEQGLTPVQILRRYYGNDIEIVENATIQNMPASYKGTPLKIGDSGTQVTIMQSALNRISKNYPSINRIPDDTIGYFGASTLDAVKEFQRIFNLTQDGIVGKSTWYKIIYVYVAVRKLAELDAESFLLDEVTPVLQESLQEGSSGAGVQAVQYYLSIISQFNNLVQPTDIDAIYGPKTTSSVRTFQQAYGLPVTGIVDIATWEKLRATYLTMADKIPNRPETALYKPFPGQDLIIGSQNNNVLLMQQYLNKIAKVYKTIPTVEETGYYGAKTAQTVSALQDAFGLAVTGTIGPVTWDAIVDTVVSIS